MDKYQNYDVEDFVSDDSFITWVLTPRQPQAARWEAWVAQNPQQLEKVTRAKNIVLSLRPKPAENELTEPEIDLILERIHQQISTEEDEVKTIPLWSTTWFRIAAILLVVLTATLVFIRKSPEPAAMVAVNQPAAMQIFENNGSQPKFITLADGSIAVLSPKSTLSYPEKFSSGERRIELTGEAFFEVQKNPEWPFVVYSKTVVTRVLGTSFTVTAFPGAEPSVTVNTGKVQVTRKNDRDEDVSTIIVTPNEMAVSENVNTALHKKMLKEPLMLSPVVAGKLFSFTEAPLADIVEKLEQAYHVPIKYDHTKYGKATVTASLSRLPLDEKVKMICKAIGAEYDFSDGTILIK